MADFATLLAELIEQRWKTRAAFCDASGIKDPYLSEILGKKRKLPTAIGLARWLGKAGVSEKDQSEIIYALSMERARRNPDFGGVVRDLERKVEDRTKLVRQLLDLSLKAGAKVPNEVISRINAL